MKVALETLGCKVNLYESEYIINTLKNHGYEIVNSDDYFDIYIINTCTVTNTSDIKSKKLIRRAKRKNPKALIVALGCFVQKNEDLPEEIDIAIGNSDKTKLLDILKEYEINKNKIVMIGELREDFEDMYIDKFDTHTRAFVKIQDGCENFCSYCIIPHVRGKCRSKDPQKVISEITSLVNNNYKEIVLTGIHTGNYGVDRGLSFADILKDILKIKGLERLRISSIEITELDTPVLDIIKDNKIIVDHLHIPLQAASNEVLKLMNRKYDLAYFVAKIAEIRALRPDVSISTDIIVAHPGETDEIFEESLKVIKEIAFSKIHVFPYSKRNGTVAAEMEQLDEKTKKKRVLKLLELSEQLEKDYRQKFINTKRPVLIEKYDGQSSTGYSDNYLYVKINKKFNPGDIVDLEIL